MPMTPPPEAMVRVVRLTPADVVPYRDMMLEAYAQPGDAFTSTAQERAAVSPSWWAQRLAEPGGGSETYGAMDDTGLVGAVSLELSRQSKTRHKAVLVGMYVRPRVRHVGVGRLLLSAAVAGARRHTALTVITLTVTEGNAAALALYQAGGFQIFGVEPKAIRGDAGYRAKVHMALDLQRPVGHDRQAGG